MENEEKQIIDIIKLLNKEKANGLETFSNLSVLKHIIQERNQAVNKANEKTSLYDKDMLNVHETLVKHASSQGRMDANSKVTLKLLVESESAWRQRCGDLIGKCRGLAGISYRKTTMLHELTSLLIQERFDIDMLESYLEGMRAGDNQ